MLSSESVMRLNLKTPERQYLGGDGDEAREPWDKAIPLVQLVSFKSQPTPELKIVYREDRTSTYYRKLFIEKGNPIPEEHISGGEVLFTSIKKKLPETDELFLFHSKELMFFQIINLTEDSLQIIKPLILAHVYPTQIEETNIFLQKISEALSVGFASTLTRDSESPPTSLVLFPSMAGSNLSSTDYGPKALERVPVNHGADPLTCS